MKIGLTAEWKTPLVQSTAEILGWTDADELDDIEGAAQVLMETDCYTKENLTALLIDNCNDSPAELMRYYEDFQKCAAEIVDIYFMETCRGRNALFSAENPAALQARMALIIADVREGFSDTFNYNAAFDPENFDQKREDRLTEQGYRFWRMAEPIETSRAWRTLPPKLFRAFCESMDKIGLALSQDDALISGLDFMGATLRKEAAKDNKSAQLHIRGADGKPSPYGRN